MFKVISVCTMDVRQVLIISLQISLSVQFQSITFYREIIFEQLTLGMLLVRVFFAFSKPRFKTYTEKLHLRNIPRNSPVSYNSMLIRFILIVRMNTCSIGGNKLCWTPNLLQRLNNRNINNSKCYEKDSYVHQGVSRM